MTGKWNAIWHSSPPAGEVAEVVDDVLRPLVRLGQQDGVRVVRVDLLPDPLEEVVGGREVFAVGAFLLVQVGHRVQAEAVDAQVQPEPQRRDDLLLDGRVLVVEVRLVGEEAVPVVLLADGVEGPVGGFGVDEDDAGVLELFVVVGPDVVVAVGAVGVFPGLLEPRVLVAGVVHDEVDDDAHAALVGGVDEFDEVGEVAEFGEDGGVVGDVVAAVAQGGFEEGRQPDAVDAEPLQIVEFGGQALEVADAVAVAVLEGTDEDLVEDGAFEPVRVPVLLRSVLEGVRDGLVDDHGVGDPPICGVDGRRTVRTWRGRAARFQAHVVRPAPAVGLAGQLVAYRHVFVPVQAELRHVQRDRGLLGVVGVEVDDHHEPCSSPRASLYAITASLSAWWKRRFRSPRSAGCATSDLVERGDAGARSYVRLVPLCPSRGGGVGTSRSRGTPRCPV